MKRKKLFAWIGVALLVVIYVRFGIIPPRRLSGAELKIKKKAAQVESIARDIRKYMAIHNGKRPDSFSDMCEIDAKYRDFKWQEVYVLPTNREANILVYQKEPWSGKNRLVYVYGRYGAYMADEQTFNNLMNGSMCWKDLRLVSRKSGCSPHQTQCSEGLNMKQDTSMFATEAILTTPVDAERPSDLLLRVQNMSRNEIWVLDDVITILVPSGIEHDDMNDAHFDFGSNPEAQYLKLSPGSWIELRVLVTDALQEMILQAMKVRVPVTVRHHRDNHDRDDRVVLLTFNVSPPPALRTGM